jgi:pilus assembly protein CpaB
MTRRRRGLLMIGLAAMCAGLAASLVAQYANEVSAQVGPLRHVLVARSALPRGAPVTPAVARDAFVQRRVPLRFAPPRTLQAPDEAVGYRTLVALSPGDYVGEAQLGALRDPATRRARAPRGRLIEIAVTGAGTIAGALRPGAVVDVLVTTDGDRGVPRTYLALQRVPLVRFMPSAGSAAGEADGTATLRTTLRQAVTLIAAQNFAREVRVVPRPDGDARRLGPTAVSAAALGR